MTSADAATTSAGALRVERPSFLTVGTVVWLSSELMFFAALFAATFTLRAESGESWRPDDVHLDVPLALVLTIVLLGSSGTQHVASRAGEAGDRAGVRRWMGLTAALGTVFVLGQAYEWSQLGFSISSHPFGSAFYTLTGFHGLHLIGGIVAMAVVLGRVSRPAPAGGADAGVEVVTAYWHFVDAVWIAVFGTLYLLS